MPALYR